MSRDQIHAAAERLEESVGVGVSGQAQNIIYYVVCAVETDPHPRWKERPSRERFLDGLPEHLAAVVAEEGVEKRVSTFDVLHWLTRNLERICPIEKIKA